MTVGKDVSALFTDVVKSMQTENIELKKLIYLYIINYARSQPDKAILVVNSFQKDADFPNPIIRALGMFFVCSLVCGSCKKMHFVFILPIFHSCWVFAIFCCLVCVPCVCMCVFVFVWFSFVHIQPFEQWDVFVWIVLQNIYVLLLRVLYLTKILMLAYTSCFFVSLLLLLLLLHRRIWPYLFSCLLFICRYGKQPPSVLPNYMILHQSWYKIKAF